MVCTNAKKFSSIYFSKPRDFNEQEPWLIAYKTEIVEMEKISFNKKYGQRTRLEMKKIVFLSFDRVTMFEDPAYQSLVEKILASKSVLLKEFEQVDKSKSGIFSLE